MRLNNGYLIISLDFELLWGVFDVLDYQKKRQYFKNTRLAIPETVKLFEKFQIHATWATVGMLFNENWDEWKENIPDSIPEYSNQDLNAYSFGNSILESNTEELCFAPKLIKQISQVAGQEIGTHTYSHYYCGEEGQDASHFEQDLLKAVDVAQKFDLNLKSLVFPRNQFKEDYLTICFDAGIQNVRSNPDAWYWKNVQSDSLITKLSRTGDAYLPFGNKGYSLPTKEKQSQLPVEQKASRFMRPFENNFLRNYKISRIKNEMEHAAKNDQIYHLWWHPHNFGEKPIESLKDLQILLEHFETLQNKYNFQSANMDELDNLRTKPI
ncbi:polysaccharide deacetylase family protein [Christiangramia sp. LLG6405-1]|uniref:polysaccharide deacetylase family protein n=1 Tax=Christiangramia sp. LLG6405-1 TaxID=3160832 RepID=UPI003866FDF5